MGEVPDALAWMQPLHRRYPLRRGYHTAHYRRTSGHAALRAAASHHRPRPGRLDGIEETGGLFLMAAASTLELIDGFEEFLEQDKAKDLLRFTTAGSVDDGKST